MKDSKKDLKRKIVDYPNEQDNSICSIDKFCGAWKSEKSAEEIASEIRNSRFFNRETEAMTYFIQFSTGQGDYTAKRDNILQGITLDEIIEEVREIDAKK